MLFALNLQKRYEVLFLVVFVIISITACGKDLSRGNAEKMISAQLRPEIKELELGNDNGVIRFTYPGRSSYQHGHRENSLGDQFVNSKFAVLAEKGLLTYKAVEIFHDDAADRHPADPSRFYYDEYLFELTPKAKSYIIKEEKRKNWGKKGNTKFVTVLLAKIDKVEVTGITNPSEGFGRKVCSANFQINYKATPFGDIFLKKGDMTKQGEAMFVLYDDGWRIANN